jgi:hypothetical protein
LRNEIFFTIMVGKGVRAERENPIHGSTTSARSDEAHRAAISSGGAMMRTPNLVLRSALLIGSLSLMIGVGTPAAAQSGYVEGVSAILSSTNASEIDTFSETYLTPDIAYYYGARVDGFLFQNSTLIASGSADRYPYENDAYGYLSRPLIVGNTYTIESDHFLVAYYIYGYDPYGFPLWWNPDYFLIATDDGSSDPSGFNFLPGGGSVYYDVQYLYLGTTGVQISSAAPSISGISPSSGVLGSSGSITVSGSNLVDIFTGSTTPAITGSGVSLSVQSQNSNEVVLNYAISNSASTGAHSLTLATRFGTSNPKPFNVGDPTPNITSISPDVWSAGATTSFTITGTGFGTNPTLDVSGTGVTGSSISSASDTEIQASVTISASASDGSATVTVTSKGHGGNGFLPAEPGQPNNTSANTSIQAIEVPQPKILLDGTDITGTTQTVAAGQRIALTTEVTLPTGLSISSQSWGNPPGKTVGDITSYTYSSSRRVGRWSRFPL